MCIRDSAEQEYWVADNLGRTIVSGQWWKIYLEVPLLSPPDGPETMSDCAAYPYFENHEELLHQTQFLLEWHCDLGGSIPPPG